MRGWTSAAEGPVVIGVDTSPAGDAVLAVVFWAVAARSTQLVAVYAWRNFLLNSAASAQDATTGRTPVASRPVEPEASSTGWS